MDFLIKLQNIFLGLVSTEPEPEEDERRPSVEDGGRADVDSDGDVDGIPLDGAALLKASGAGAQRPDSRASEDSDVDGEPLRGQEEAVRPSPAPPARSGGFVTSKWETVDPEQVKAGAMTTSKWDAEETEPLLKARKALMGSVASKWDDREDVDGDPIKDDGDSDEHDFPEMDTRVTEERRQLLREIEVKVMQYQDELEGGRKGIKAGWTISEQVEHYRKKLHRRAAEKQEEAADDSPPRSERSSRSDRDKEKSKKKKRRRSRSESSSRSRSRDRDKKSRRRRRSSGSSDNDRESRKREKSRDKGRSRSRSRSKSRRQSKRSRSRSRSPRKHKKKRH